MSVDKLAGICVRLSELHRADFLPFIHLQWHPVEQFSVQSTQSIVRVKQSTAKTVEKNKKIRKEKNDRVSNV
jgi:hypothetical protein